MAISASDVSRLREQTGAGMMDCKKALEATAGDFEQAVDHLRKQGLKSADKKAGRATGEGRVFARIDADGRGGTLVAVQCETDFVARTPDFDRLLQELCEHVEEHEPRSIEEMLRQPWRGGETVETMMRATIGRLGENLQLAAATRLALSDGQVGAYVHHNQKVGAIAAVRTPAPRERAQEVLKTLCMHIVAKAPIAARRDEVPAERIERERAIYLEEVKGKPENIQEKIVGGKLDKYFAETVLTEQPWVLDDSLSVAAALERELGKGTHLVSFVRYAVGS